ncbi:MAG: hypothetical protein QME79_06530 [Bacillota bacterium]|nr:hypothetical protein [Bacillota bacterium]
MESVSATLDRHGREALRRIESRLLALEAGIARHEARLSELKGIKERVQAERDELLAKLTPPVSAPPVESAASAEAKAGGSDAGGGRGERVGVKQGPPPEAEAVPETAGLSPEQLWERFWHRRENQRPPVIYPWSCPSELGTAPELTDPA